MKTKPSLLIPLLLLSVIVLLAASATAVRGQSAFDGFDPNANGIIRVVVVQPEGKILIGGDFTTLAPNGGATVTRNHIARLNPDGTLDSGFDPNANGTVYAIAVQADCRIVVGGSFSGANSIGGQLRNRIARLNPDGTLDTVFDPNASNDVYALAVQADGKILAGGAFTGVGGTTRNRIARLDNVTGLPDSLDPNADNDVRVIALQPNGQILTAGLFNTIGGQTRHKIARLDPANGTADSFNPNANNTVLSIALQADGKILAGGSFGTISGQTRNKIARLDAATGLADSFNPNASSIVNAIAVQPDGKILAGGLFISIGGATRNHLARLDPATGLADSFDPNANGQVLAIAVQPDGKILAGGDFASLAPSGGTTVTRNRIARLETDGRLDQTLDLGIVGIIGLATAVLQPDGKILIGGGFSMVLGVARNNIARLNSDGTLDNAFNPNANDLVLAIAVQPDGKILASGFFTSIGGAKRNRLARLDPATGLADSFDPNANDRVTPIAVQADGKILVGGDFTNIGGQLRNRIARLDAITGAADSFEPNANDTVYSVAVQADGKILVGGEFTNIGGQTRNFLARLTNDTAALQNLAVTQSSVTWILGGSSPQLARAVFEYSTDNVNYIFLGNGVPQSGSSNWILTGLNFATGQNFYIRARGYYHGGVYSGSESITESVRNAFIPSPPTPSQVVSRKLHNGVPFDVDLPVTGTPGIECRSGGATNDYTMVVTFGSAVTVTGNPQAQVTSGTGDIGSGGVSNGGMVTVSGNTVTVPLTNIANAQTINVTLNGVNGSSNVVIPMSVLVGDSNGNGTVNAADVSQTKSRIGQPVDATNFRSDVNANGTLNAADVAVVKANIGNGLPHL